jgi:hypothetical protein
MHFPGHYSLPSDAAELATDKQPLGLEHTLSFKMRRCDSITRKEREMRAEREKERAERSTQRAKAENSERFSSAGPYRNPEMPLEDEAEISTDKRSSGIEHTLSFKIRRCDSITRKEREMQAEKKRAEKTKEGVERTKRTKAENPKRFSSTGPYPNTARREAPLGDQTPGPLSNDSTTKTAEDLTQRMQRRNKAQRKWEEAAKARQFFRASTQQSKWAQLKANHGSDYVLSGLTFTDFPWPINDKTVSTPEDIDKKALSAYLKGLDRLRMKRALLLWHPDKFEAVKMCFDERDHTAIAQGVQNVLLALLKFRDEK